MSHSAFSILALCHTLTCAVEPMVTAASSSVSELNSKWLALRTAQPVQPVADWLLCQRQLGVCWCLGPVRHGLSQISVRGLKYFVDSFTFKSVSLELFTFEREGPRVFSVWGLGLETNVSSLIHETGR